MDSIGQQLKDTREETGISLKEASKDLDIKEEILENIEDGKIGAFKDVFELKTYIINYAKYLGLDSEKLIDEFNDYLFEYTSKIPVKELEKTIELKLKEDKKDDDKKIVSPYTTKPLKMKKKYYILIYIGLIILVLLAILWSVKQITIGNMVSNTISYRK